MGFIILVMKHQKYFFQVRSWQNGGYTEFLRRCRFYKGFTPGNLIPAIFYLETKNQSFFNSIEHQQDKYVGFLRYIDFSLHGALLEKKV